MRLVEVGRVCSDYRKMRRKHVKVYFTANVKLVEIGTVSFGYCKVCMGFVVVRRVHFDYRNACMRLVEVSIVRFDYRKACRKLVQVMRSPF